MNELNNVLSRKYQFLYRVKILDYQKSLECWEWCREGLTGGCSWWGDRGARGSACGKSRCEANRSPAKPIIKIGTYLLMATEHTRPKIHICRLSPDIFPEWLQLSRICQLQNWRGTLGEMNFNFEWTMNAMSAFSLNLLEFLMFNQI